MGIPSDSFFDVGSLLPGEMALLEGVKILRLRDETCPYFPDGRPRESLNFIAPFLDAGVYEALISFGWRRCGRLFYKSVCPSCRDCQPLRVDVSLFKPDRSQRRCANLNKDMLISVGEVEDSDEDFELFTRYCASRHGAKEQSHEEFRLFLASPPLPALALRHRLQDGRLVCVAWIDVLPNSLSAVYTAFEPDLPERGLGVFSILMQLELCRRNGRSHLQMGFQIDGCRKMSYKSRYKPCQMAGPDGRWS